MAGDNLNTDNDLAALSADELRDMFDKSESMNTSPS
jgi:hypothetical protein